MSDLNAIYKASIRVIYSPFKEQTVYLCRDCFGKFVKYPDGHLHQGVITFGNCLPEKFVCEGCKQ